MDISKIDDPYLVASSLPFDAKDIRSLHRQNVRAIVSLTERSLIGMSDITEALFSELDMRYFHGPTRDHYPPTLNQALQMLNFIEEMKMQGRVTFVHCHAGVGRTGTLLHLYFLGQGYDLAEAQAVVKRRRIQCMLLSDEQKAFLQACAKRGNLLA